MNILLVYQIYPDSFCSFGHTPIFVSMIKDLPLLVLWTIASMLTKNGLKNFLYIFL